MPILSAFMVPHPPMIIPDIGKGSESQIKETTAAYERAAREIAGQNPDTVIITSPHATMYADYFHISPGRSAKGSFRQFRAPQVHFEEMYDEELSDEISSLAALRGFPAGVMGERDRQLDHGTMVPLWFIRRAMQDRESSDPFLQHTAKGSKQPRSSQENTAFKILRIGLSGLPLTSHYEFGGLIAEAVNRLNRRVVFVASGDLSHKLQPYGPYGFAPEGPQYDARIMDVCGRAAFGELLDFDEVFCENAAECGHRSFVIMAGALDGLRVNANVLSHQDVTGVGYGICTFYPEGEDESRHFLKMHLQKKESELMEKNANSDAYVNLARKSLESYITEKKIISAPAGLPEEMTSRRAGAFVSIHEHGKLRGCIGTILPTRKNLAEEIIRNAISASTEDPRFDPIRPDELKWLEINVDVLGEPEKISTPGELDVKKYGVIVSCGRRRGLLLPDLDGVDSVEQQISIARQKGGIRENESYTLERFEVVRHR